MWIGLLAVDDDRGDRFFQTMIPLLSKNGICAAFALKLPKLTYLSDLTDLVVKQAEKSKVLYDDKVNVCFVYGEPPSVYVLRLLFFLFPLISLQPIHKEWIVTSQWDFRSVSYQKIWDIESLHGAISFTVQSKELSGFQTFLRAINPFGGKGDGFIKDFWEQAFSCSLTFSNIHSESRNICTGEEKLENLPGIFFEMRMTGHSYNVYNAVYAVAHALQSFNLSRSTHRRNVDIQLLFQNVQSWQLNNFIRSITFNNSVDEAIHFNENGELKAGFDITNWVTYPNGSFIRAEVGRFDPWAPPGKEFTIHDYQIVWHRTFNQVLPLSACSKKCLPGYSKKKKEGEEFCCYDCDPCPEGMISEQMGRKQNV
uniref:Uncharacterized protein n=1 Tax=Sphaerodactylus townsendi TaxID=933632 RepID=A0ACB8EV97_9SAUR